MFRQTQLISQHCYVTGGSSGLGRALAIDLVKRGASVTIVARGQGRLDEVKAELQVRFRSSQSVFFNAGLLCSSKRYGVEGVRMIPVLQRNKLRV